MNYFKDYFSNQIEQHLFTSYEESVTSIPKDFLINHIYGSFLEMVKWWVSRNMKQSPEAVQTPNIRVTVYSGSFQTRCSQFLGRFICNSGRFRA